MFAQRTAWNLAPNRFSRAIEEHRKTKRELLDLSASNQTAVGLEGNGAEVVHSLCVTRTLDYHPDSNGFAMARVAVARYSLQRDQAPIALTVACVNHNTDTH